MKYHSNNLKRINAVVKDLWQKTFVFKVAFTLNIERHKQCHMHASLFSHFYLFLVSRYKGNDISEIEIKADASANSRSVGSFQYSVVMRKGGAEMPMRQRCSAGQKVLASLVIRLALADIYGAKCSIMALDEPTTNLDKRHKDSLARALADIIEQRSKFANFQLILITHDRSFVDTLQQFQVRSDTLMTCGDALSHCHWLTTFSFCILLRADAEWPSR